MKVKDLYKIIGGLQNSDDVRLIETHEIDNLEIEVEYDFYVAVDRPGVITLRKRDRFLTRTIKENIK